MDNEKLVEGVNMSYDEPLEAKFSRLSRYYGDLEERVRKLEAILRSHGDMISSRLSM